MGEGWSLAAPGKGCPTEKQKFLCTSLCLGRGHALPGSGTLRSRDLLGRPSPPPTPRPPRRRLVASRLGSRFRGAVPGPATHPESERRRQSGRSNPALPAPTWARDRLNFATPAGPRRPTPPEQGKVAPDAAARPGSVPCRAGQGHPKLGPRPVQGPRPRPAGTPGRASALALPAETARRSAPYLAPGPGASGSRGTAGPGAARATPGR